MANTHYYLVAGDLHVRGQQHVQHRIMDPLQGQILGLVSAPATTPPLNSIARGATTGAIGRVVRVIDGQTFVLESLPHPTIGVAGAGFAVGNPIGELVNFDNGSSGYVNFAASSHAYPLFQQFTSQHLDAALNAFTPSDRSDKPYWYAKAKFSRQIILTGASVLGDVSFVRGNRFTTSAGASGTILLGNAIGSDYGLQIIRAAGTFTAGDIVTITSTGETGTILSVGADTQQGAWLEHHVLPNLNGSGSLWEFPPHAQGPDYGPSIPIVQSAHEFHAAADDVADRAARVIPFALTDHVDDVTLGGVTVQVVKCSGTFPTTWIAGEPVTSGTWSATVHGFSATNKYLFVVATNGETLAAGTVTATLSGSTATSTGAAYGWQKGSTHWNNLVAETTKALASTDALYGGAAAKWEGIFLMPWDTDVGTFASGVGASWPSISVAQNGWVQLVEDLRAHFGREDLPIAVWQHLPEARSDVTAGGFNYSLYLKLQIDSLPGIIPKLSVVRSDGLEFAHDPTLSIPVPTSLTYLRADDYQTLGERAWRGMRLYNTEIPTGNFELFPIVVVAGQSQQVGNIPSSTLMGLDRDPLLYPSASFPGVNTLDANCLSFNTITNEWEVFDIATNANHFFGMASGTCGPETPLMARQKKRWSKVLGETGRVGLIKVAVSASSAYAGSYTAPATWDPAITTSPQTVASCTVTVIAATMMSPARGRFTAAAGTFSSGWVVGMSGAVAGSALGIQGYGGNNTAQYGTNYVAAVATDGSYVEFYGAFVAEGPLSFTLTAGPHALAPLVEDVIRQAFIKATDLRLIPFPALLVWENGEGDVAFASAYKDALLRTLTWLERILGGRLKGQTAIAKVIVQLSSTSPMPVTDEVITQIRDIQTEVAAELENATTVDPSSLPMEASGVWPITSRTDNGVHRTARGHLMCGYMVDEASGSLTGIPAHPDGSAAIDFGIDGGGTTTGADSGTDAGTDAGTDFEGTEVPVLGTLVVEDGTGLADAESYLSVADADTRAVQRGNPTEWSSATTAQKQNWLRNSASAGIDIVFGQRWSGYRRTDDQALDWPREGAGDSRTGRFVSNTTIPAGVKHAQFEFALSLALGVDPLRNLDPSDPEERSSWASSTDDAMPGGFREGRTYDRGAPVFAVLARMNAFALPFLLDDDGRVALA